MNNRGIVAALSPQGKVVAIETESHGFTIVDVDADSVFSREDVIEWKDSSGVGFAVYRNVTRRTLVRVSVRRHDASANEVSTALTIEPY